MIRVDESRHIDRKAGKVDHGYSPYRENGNSRTRERGFFGSEAERKKTHAVKVHRDEEAAEAVGERNNYGL